MDRKEILEALEAFPYDRGGYGVITGAAMVLYGIREQTADIDLGCTAELADRMEADGLPFRRTGDGKRWLRYGDTVEIFEEWLQDTVVTVDGFPVVSLRGLIGMKQALGREKDLRDIALIRAYMGRSVVVKKMETADEIRGKAFVAWRSWHETYPGLIGREYLDRHTLESCEQAAFRWPEGHIVAKDGDRVVGYAAYGAQEDTPGTGEVFGLYVMSEYHGTGVGRRLMQAALEQLKAYPVICLWTLKENRQAIRFYEKCGFAADGQEQVNVRINAREIRMTLADRSILQRRDQHE